MTGRQRVSAWASLARRGLARWASRAVWPRARRLGLGRNNLRRRSDRIESAGLLVAWALVLAAVPLAVAVGMTVHRNGLVAAAAETATRQQVLVVLVENVPVGIRSEVGIDQRMPALARWEWPPGTPHTGTIQAASGLAAGAQVTAWVDTSGQAVDPPLTHDQVLGRAVAAAIVLFGLVLLALRITFAAFRRWLDAKRWAKWEADWTHIGPQWTRHPR